MGTTNEYKSTNIGQGLIGKECDNCHKKITEYDVCENNNWDIQFDTTEPVQLVNNEKKGYGYDLTIWIRNVYHEYCDEAEESNKEVEEAKKTEWQKLGDRIKHLHPLEIYNESLKKIIKLRKKTG